MSALEDLETNLNQAVVDFQNKVAELITVAKAAPSDPAPVGDDAQVDADLAKVEGDEAALDADTATAATDQAADEAADGPAAPSDPTNIPVTDGSEPAAPADPAAPVDPNAPVDTPPVDPAV